MQLFQINVRLGPDIDTTPRDRRFYVYADNLDSAMQRLHLHLSERVSPNWSCNCERLDVLQLHGVLS